MGWEGEGESKGGVSMQGNYYQEYGNIEFPITLGEIFHAEGENLHEVVWAGLKQKALHVRELEERLLSLFQLDGQVEAEIQEAVERYVAEFPELDPGEVKRVLREEILWNMGAGIEAEIAELRTQDVIIAERELEKEEQERERPYREAVKLFFSEGWIGAFVRGLALWKGVDIEFVHRLISFAEFVPSDLDVESHLPKIIWARVRKFHNRSFLIVDRAEPLDLKTGLKAVRRFLKNESRKKAAWLRAKQREEREKLKRRLKQVRQWLFRLRDKKQWSFYRTRASELWEKLKDKHRREWERYYEWKRQSLEVLKNLLKEKVTKINQQRMLKRKKAIQKKIVFPATLTKTTRSGMVGTGRIYKSYPLLEQRIYEYLLQLWKDIPVPDVDPVYAHNLEMTLKHWVNSWSPEQKLAVLGEKKILEKRIKAKLSIT
ncbi:MAG: hypothetical protein DRP29_03580 [Thermodesulfobacteriota bacterium]|nr:MAG: hypothetical protein DRP29_03580 [Thermodesulfobacteriota bacterium]